MLVFRSQRFARPHVRFSDFAQLRSNYFAAILFYGYIQRGVQPSPVEGEATGCGRALCLSLRLRCDPRGWQRG